jgi:LmbE family N-acetylglucosaminyl deacetylase
MYMDHSDLKIEIVENSGDHQIDENLKNLIDSSEGIIIFSPHLDDAILSMGALCSYLSEQKKKTEVYSIFTQASKILTSSIQIMLRRAGFEDSENYFEVRRKEDLEAWKALGISMVNHLGYTDAAWRTEEEGPIYPTNQIANVAVQDEKLIKKLENEIEEIVKYKKNYIVFAPLAVGGHADHQILNIAVKNVCKNLVFFADFPYSLTWPEDKPVPGLDDNLKLSLWGEGLENKREAILKYKSQLPSFIPFSNDGILTLTSEKYYISVSV